MTFYCIADEDTVRGFRLAGVEGCAVASAGEAADALRNAVAKTPAGIVILTEAVADWVRDQLELGRREPGGPLLVEIPGPEGPLGGRRSLRQVVHAAVGIRLDPGKGG